MSWCQDARKENHKESYARIHCYAPAPLNAATACISVARGRSTKTIVRCQCHKGQKYWTRSPGRGETACNKSTRSSGQGVQAEEKLPVNESTSERVLSKSTRSERPWKESPGVLTCNPSSGHVSIRRSHVPSRGTKRKMC